VDIWRTLFWHVLATYTRRVSRDIFVLMDQTKRFKPVLIEVAIG
jgi:hypothetical protein